MRLHKKTRQIRITQEGAPPKSLSAKLNLSRYLYFVVFFGIIAFVIYLVFQKTLYIQGVGLITFNPIMIRAEYDMKLTQLYVNEGEIVKNNDRLFRNQSIKDDDKTYNSSIDVSMIHQKIARVELEIEQKKISNKYLSQKIDLHREELSRLERMVALELVVRNAIYEEKKKMEEIAAEISTTKKEIAALYTYRKQLLDSLNNIVPVSVVKAGPEVRDVHSPIEGQIVQIIVNENEIAIKGEPVIEISSLENMIIKGYFEQKKIEFLEVGRPVKIEFPDDTTSYGKISRFYYSTLPLPEEFQKKYEPVQRDVIADIVPMPGEEMKWLKYHKLSVKLKISRYERWMF